MLRTFLIAACSLFATTVIAADQPSTSAPATAVAATASAAKADTGPKALSGMSILGNQEAPKALVIVPWKSSQIGDSPGISKTLDDGRQPVDKDVFMRQLRYYEIRAKAK